MAAILHHLSVHPHAVVIQTLILISDKVLHPNQQLPPSMQAEAFSDSALLQVGNGRFCHKLTQICRAWKMSHCLVPTPGTARNINDLACMS